MKSLFVVVLVLCNTAVCQRNEYIFIPDKLSRDSAQRYCKEKFMDLATISTDQENQRVMDSALSSTYSWIGLTRTAPYSNIWEWADGESPQFFNWRKGQPDNLTGADNCVVVSPWGWHDAHCAAVFPFVCSWRFVVVNDRKTWDEALDYCRRFYTGLASPISPEQHILAKSATAQTQTVRVWTGVVFIDGRWVSVSGTPLGSLVLPASCPAPQFRCGALNTDADVWENRDCNEKLHFLCY